jgi:hypothetical protein
VTQSIYKFDVQVGRMGDLSGIFVTTKNEIDEIINSERIVYFGECLGKHSDIYFKLKDDMFTLVSDNQDFVNIFNDHDMETGVNPVSRYQDYKNDGGYDDDEEEE